MQYDEINLADTNMYEEHINSNCDNHINNNLQTIKNSIGSTSSFKKRSKYEDGISTETPRSGLFYTYN